MTSQMPTVFIKLFKRCSFGRYSPNGRPCRDDKHRSCTRIGKNWILASPRPCGDAVFILSRQFPCQTGVAGFPALNRLWKPFAQSLFGDNENFAAAVARCLGLADIGLRETVCHRALKFGETGTLEHFDGKVSAWLQGVGGEFKCQLGQMDASRLIDA